MKKLHYGIFVAIGCFLIMFYGLGMTFNLVSLFLSNMVSERGFSQSQISDAMTLQSIVSLLCIFLLGKVYAKYSTRRTVALCSMAGVLAYICFSFDSLPACYLGATLVGVAHGGAALVPVSLLITSWFEKNRGAALSICMMGSSGANVFCSKVASVLLDRWGLARTSMVHAGTIFILIVLAMLLIRDEPSDKGLLPFGAERTAAVPSPPGTAPADAPPPQHAKVRSSDYVAVAAASFMIGFVITPINAFYPTFLRSVGYETLFLGTAATIFGITMCLSKLITGTIIDALGLRLASVYLYVLPFAAVVSAMLVTPAPQSALVFVVLWGIGNPIGTVPLPLWVQKIFGAEDYKLTYILILTVLTLGSTLGFWLIGKMADYFGTYLYFFIIDLVMLAASFFLLMRCVKSTKSSLAEKRSCHHG